MTPMTITLSLRFSVSSVPGGQDYSRFADIPHIGRAGDDFTD